MPIFSPGASGWGTTGLQWSGTGANLIGIDPTTGAKYDAKGNLIGDAQSDMTGAAMRTPDQMGVANPTGYGASYGNYLSGLSGAGATNGMTSLATGSSVGGNYSADKQLAQARDEFRLMREGARGARYEEDMARGMFSSGVGSKLMADTMHGIDLQEGASIERILNDLLGRQQSYDLQKQQMDYQNQLAQKQAYAGMGSQRFGDANLNQQLMGAYSSKGGGGGSSMPGGTMVDPAMGGGGPGADPKTGEPVRGSGESYDDYMSRWNSWFNSKKAKPAANAVTSGLNAVASGFSDMMGGFGF